MRFFGKARILQLATVAAAVVALSAGDALARGRGGYGSSGSYGSYGSYGSSGSYASYSSYGSYGSSGSYASYSSYGSSGSSGRSGGLFSRWHARKAARGSSGSYGGYGSHGSSGAYMVSYGSSGSYGSYGGYGSYSSYSSCGSSGGGAYYGDTYYEGDYTAPVGPSSVGPPPAPGAGGAVPTTPQPAVGPEGGAPPTPPSASATEAEIFVSLPEDAKVFVNDLATSSTGAQRHYVSRGLQSGQLYSYKLRVEYQRDGQPVTEDKLVRLQAGRTVKLAFGEQATQQAATELKLHVPADARVTLAGAETEQTGEVRSYESSNLKPGQKWDGYLVRVELEKDGKTLVEERTIDIEGGKSYELTFEMTGGATQVASAN
jgi:uncharacterized protein (TIGR03000 family)